jgi:carboxyl-terminal processing protease
MKRKFSTISVTILCTLALLLGMHITTLISGDNIFEQINKFKDVLSLTEKFYVDDVDTPKLVESAINGLLSQLDPHSVYIPASQLPKINEEFRGTFEGIGIEYDVIGDTLYVVSTIFGGPSEALGILAGDKIVKINDTSCVGIKRDEVPKKLRGPKGTRVKVSIVRAGEPELIEFEIIRDKIPIYSVDVAYMVNKDVAYIHINRFMERTNQEFVEAVEKLRSKGMKKLILDLRGNPGGYLDQAFRMANEFLPKGKKIVYTKARRSEFDEEYISTGDGHAIDIPLIVLINHSSASASEIVSGAIQDWDRGLIVGETSFGKGLVQRQFELGDKSALRLTIARYYTPSGRLIQRPYDNKDFREYRQVKDDEEEGENIDHTQESDSTRPVFKTSSGRKVLGGGGITPDYIVKEERFTTYTADLFRKGVFFDYSTKYLERNGKQLRQKYEKDVERFVEDFKVSDEMLNEFTDLAEKKGVKMNEEQFQKDQTYIKTQIKARIARNIWGNEGYFPVLLTEDVQFQKALTLFPEAQRIAGLR